MSLYKGTIRINEVYLGEVNQFSIFNSTDLIVPLNKEMYVWLLEDVVRHRHYVWRDVNFWNDSFLWTEDTGFTFSAFDEYGSDMFDGLDETGLMTTHNLMTTDVLYE